MLDAIANILGVYAPLQGSGIASINFNWLAGAAFFLITVWFLYKLILRLIGGGRS